VRGLPVPTLLVFADVIDAPALIDAVEAFLGSPD
jgi:hypothetical protein